MTRMPRAIAVVIALAAIVYAVVRSTFLSPQPKDELRWGKIENHDILGAMGARLWRLHIPAAQLEGKSRLILKMENTERQSRDVVRAPLNERRPASDPLDLTVVLYFIHPISGQASHLSLTLTSAEFTWNSTIGNPLPNSNGYSRSNELGDLATGIELCQFSLSSEGDKPEAEKCVRFFLRLE